MMNPIDGALSGDMADSGGIAVKTTQNLLDLRTSMESDMDIKRLGLQLKDADLDSGEFYNWTFVPLLSVISVSLLVFYFGLWLLHVIVIVYGRLKLHRKVRSADPELKVEGVSVIKPLTCVDEHILHNLETFFELNYPKYELLFCIQNKKDEEIGDEVKNLCAKYPHVDASLFYGGQKVGINPKINNMMPGYLAAKYQLLLISDAGIHMEKDSLTDMVNTMKNHVGLVFQLPYTGDGKGGYAETLEKIFFGTFQARFVLISDILGINCVTGMSALIKKHLLEKAGGFKAFGCYLAEDFFMAEAIKKQKHSLAISSRPAVQNMGGKSIAKFEKRQWRWLKLRLAMVPVSTLSEPFSDCFLSGCLAALSLWYLEIPGTMFDSPPAHLISLFFLLHTILWFLADWFLIHTVQGGELPCSFLTYLAMWLYREVVQSFVRALYLRLKAYLEPNIRWGSNMFRIKSGGKVVKNLLSHEECKYL